MTNDAPTTGFAVSIFPVMEKALPIGEISARDLTEFRRKVARILRANARAYLGSWHDTEAHMVYLDITIVEPDKETAIALAKSHGQEGMYDLEKKQTIIAKEEGERRLASSADGAHARSSGNAANGLGLRGDSASRRADSRGSHGNPDRVIQSNFAGAFCAGAGLCAKPPPVQGIPHFRRNRHLSLVIP
jgi:hypothetical protein